MNTHHTQGINQPRGSENAGGGNPLVYRLEPELVARPWGRVGLGEWYPEREHVDRRQIGEAWYTGEKSEAQPIEAGGLAARSMPLPRLGEAEASGFGVLVKLLFPEQPLSVQVHPDDAYAAANGFACGKTEAWYIIAAQPGAQLGVGLRPGVDLQSFEHACRSHRGADALNWIGAVPGELIFVPAGTVHAIGGGVVICEVQQPSDVTFRLDDYGRRDAAGRLRDLHWEHGFAVARPTEAGRVAAADKEGGSAELLTTPHFSVRRWQMQGAEREIAAASAGRAEIWMNVNQPGQPPMIARFGRGRDAAALDFRAGNAILVPSATETRSLKGFGAMLTITRPAQEARA